MIMKATVLGAPKEEAGKDDKTDSISLYLTIISNMRGSETGSRSGKVDA